MVRSPEMLIHTTLPCFESNRSRSRSPLEVGVYPATGVVSTSITHPLSQTCGGASRIPRRHCWSTAVHPLALGLRTFAYTTDEAAEGMARPLNGIGFICSCWLSSSSRLFKDQRHLVGKFPQHGRLMCSVLPRREQLGLLHPAFFQDSRLSRQTMEAFRTSPVEFPQASRLKLNFLRCLP